MKPHQCSIAFLEPCSIWGIRTNVKRALAAVAFIRSITRVSLQVTGYSIRGRPVAKLDKDTPNRRPVEGKPSPAATVISRARLGGLHHRYSWREAA
jgi:hypothetical protein